MTDFLALIGLTVVAKKGYEFYRRYRHLKQENAFLREAKGPDSSAKGRAVPTPQSP